MIITRSPLRISLGGGGTDLESYYSHHGGFIIAAAIDKYVYVSVNKPFNQGFHLKYSEIENVTAKNDIKHPIIREALNSLMPKCSELEITSVADIPAGTGLGSSGSFTTALLKALAITSNKALATDQLAEMACHIEIDKLKQPIGKQDQYIAALGGITAFTFNHDGKVTYEAINLSTEMMNFMSNNLMLFFTGFTRSASEVLLDQKIKSEKKDIEMIRNLHRVKEIGLESKKHLENNDFESFGRLMHTHWENKKKRSKAMSSSVIDGYYNLAMEAGAYGGKIVGAGGGGFLLIAAPNPNDIRETFQRIGLREIPFSFDFEGTRMI